MGLLPRFPRIILICLLFLTTTKAVFAQQRDTLEVALPEIEIEASRAAETTATAPFAIALRQRTPEDLAMEPGLSLETVLRGLPGVQINDRSHYALGERLMIRGMGWRSAFGVRGVQVLLDGIPLTLPDGQAVLDIADPAFIRQAEVIRGPSSLFWGNGSGGVLFLSTQALADSTALRIRALGGSYSLRQISAEATHTPGRHRLHAYASHVRHDGYRMHSAGRFTRAGLHGSFDLGARTSLRITTAFAGQEAENPGALTQEQVDVNPRQADPRTIQTQAGKHSTQMQTGATLYHQTPLGLLTATVYGLLRDLDNPLTFTYVALDRRTSGTRLQLQKNRSRLAWGIGVDAGWMQDDRLNLNNVEGQAGADISLDQQETVRNVAAFGYLTYTLAAGLELHAGTRLDATRFSMVDHLLGDGDQSGVETFSAWSPAFGISYKTRTTLFFAHYSTAFETPTTTELVNRPDGTGGFNMDLAPQHTQGFEVGTRGIWEAARLRFDAALFRLYVRDRLLPFQNEEGRTFFRNAGANTHDGVEVALTWQPHARLDVQATYTGSRFVFDDAALRDNRIPGVPSHHLTLHLQTTQRHLRLHLALEAVSSAFADDTNETKNEGYVTLDINLGYAGLQWDILRMQPFLALSNLTDTAYTGSLVVNAFGGRYFEPSPGRSVQAGVQVTL